MGMQRLNVLISGAGIAGFALAYWLARDGTRVTVVERGGGQRSSDSPGDVRGEAVAIAVRNAARRVFIATHMARRRATRPRQSRSAYSAGREP